MCSCTEFTLQGAVCEASYIVHTLIGNATPHCIHHRLCNLPTESLNVSSSSTSSPSFFTSGVIFTLWALHGASGQSCARLDSSNVPQNTDLPKVSTKSKSMTPSWVIKTQNFQAVVCIPWIYQFLGCSQQFGIYSGSLQFHTRKTYKNQKPNKSSSPQQNLTLFGLKRIFSGDGSSAAFSTAPVSEVWNNLQAAWREWLEWPFNLFWLLERRRYQETWQTLRDGKSRNRSRNLKPRGMTGYDGMIHSTSV